MEVIDNADGLWLEKRAVRLTWRSSLARLRATTSPDSCVISREDPLLATVLWKDRVWGGLECQVSTVFGDDRPTRKALHSVRIAFVSPGRLRSPRDASLWMRGQLVERYGPPAAPGDGRDPQRDEATWNVGDVSILHRYCNDASGSHYVFVSVAEAPTAAG